MEKVSEEIQQVNPTNKLEELKSLKRRAALCLNDIAGSSLSVAKREKVENENRQKYSSLIRSFDNKTWKHSDLCARELASQGWRNKNGRNVQCDSCNKIICTDLPNILENIEVYRKCLSNIRRQLADAHQLTCPRRSTPLRLLRYENAEEVSRDIIEKLESYDTKLTMKLEFTRDVPTSKFPPFSRDFIIAALLNWRISQKKILLGRSRVVAFCDLCNRTLSLSSSDVFDPVASHMKWCPLLDLDSSNVPVWLAHLSLLTEEKTVQICTDSTKITVDRVKALIRRSFSSVSITSLTN